MRGTQGRWRPRGRHCGIIPAYAGNTISLRRRPCGCRDHPRVCGEHGLSGWGSMRLVGSSPRMRGTLCLRFGVHLSGGIIPAYAGNTRRCVCRYTRRGDHPRVCGEHLLNATLAERAPGSSPRMRGTHVTLLPSFCPPGIIPAYAGNTSNLSPCSR